MNQRILISEAMMCESASGGIVVTNEVNIVQEVHQDPNAITWHTTVKLTTADQISIDRHPGGRHRRELTDAGLSLVDRLLQIGGIHSLELRHHKITVHKGPAFKWETVNPPVHAALIDMVSKATGAPKSTIKIKHPDPS